MNSPDTLFLQNALALCATHADALADALRDIHARQFEAADLVRPEASDRRLLDQFAYRYTRLQDDIGAKLMPAALRALGEDVSALPAMDRFNRLEQIGWLDSTEQWIELRRLRNEFTHDYPANPAERHARFSAAVHASETLLGILARLNAKITERFPHIGQAP